MDKCMTQVAGDIMEFPVLTVFRDASMAHVAHLLRCVLHVYAVDIHGT